MSLQMTVVSGQTGPDKPTEGASSEDRGDRPAWLPEGFNSPEELREAYDKLMTSGKNEGAGDPPASNTDPSGGDDNGAINKFVSAAGLSMEELQRQVNETGDVSAETLEALEAQAEKSGLTKGVVKEFIDGRKAKAADFVSNIYNLAGGQEGYAKMAAWAQQNLSKEELKTFSDMMESGNPENAKFAVKALAAQFRTSNRIPGKLLTGTSMPAGGDVFESMEQQVAAQSDPRYKEDPAFRRAVEAKIARTIQQRRR